MGVLIDASVLIGYERGLVDVASRIGSRADASFFLSVITVSELLHGVHRADSDIRRARRSVFVESIIDRFPRLSIGLPTARVHAELWSEQASQGKPIGAHDLWLASAAVAHGLTLATLNMREFGRISRLEVEDWSSAASSTDG